MRFFKLALIVIVLAFMAMAQEPVTAILKWSPPQTGGAVENYLVQVIPEGLDTLRVVTPDTFIVVTIIPGTNYTARVAGVNACGQQGSWSELADTYCWDEIPGSCQKPSFN